MCSAGISVNAGIPDLPRQVPDPDQIIQLERSFSLGIFSRLKEKGLSQPEDVFSIEFFRDDPKPFYR